MSSRLLYLGAALAATLPLHAITLDDANRAFAAGKFHESTQAYQALLQQDGYSAPVLYDLGNSLVREGDLPHAIVAYKRALWLDPNDADTRANLATAQKEAGLERPSEPRLQKLAAVMSAGSWAWTGFACWLLLCVLLLSRALFPQMRGLLSVGAVADTCLLAVAVLGAIAASAELRQVVVVEKNANALISPFPDATTVFTPAPGQIITAQKSYNDFVLVADNAGHTGWIARRQVEPVVP
jgi:tetratricopeptide (TPR) repeat protein